MNLAFVESSKLCLFQNTESPQELKDGLWNELKKADDYLDAKCTADYLLGEKVSTDENTNLNYVQNSRNRIESLCF